MELEIADCIVCDEPLNDGSILCSLCKNDKAMMQQIHEYIVEDTKKHWREYYNIKNGKGDWTAKDWRRHYAIKNAKKKVRND